MTGCSAIFVRLPPSDHEKLAYFDCSSSAAAPATDTTMAVFGALGVIGSTYDDPDTAANERSPGIARGFGVVAAASLLSAVYGFYASSRCESAKEQLELRVRNVHAEREALVRARTQRQPEAEGCHSDSDCKGERLCVNTLCVDPPPAASPTLGQSPPAAPAGPTPAVGTFPAATPAAGSAPAADAPAGASPAASKRTP